MSPLPPARCRLRQHATRWFDRFAKAVADAAGSAPAFLLALLLVLGWAASGPWFGWSDSHSLFINTVTTIVTFMMTFLIQGSQNRTEASLHRKIDELVRAMPGARDEVAGCEQEDAP